MGMSSQRNEKILNKIQMDKRVKSRTVEAILAEMKSEERLLCWVADTFKMDIWGNKLSIIFCCIALCGSLADEKIKGTGLSNWQMLVLCFQEKP